MDITLTLVVEWISPVTKKILISVKGVKSGREAEHILESVDI